MRMEAIGTSCYFAECPLVAEGVEDVRSEPSAGVHLLEGADFFRFRLSLLWRFCVVELVG